MPPTKHDSDPGMGAGSADRGRMEPAAGSDLEAVAAVIERLALWLRRQAPTAVSSSTVTTLDTLLTRGPLRICELAEHEAISQPGMTTLVNRLEAAGEAQRIADPTDGRATLVRITDRGRRVLAERHTSRTSALLAELTRLAPADRAALIAALPAVERLISRDAERAASASSATASSATVSSATASSTTVSSTTEAPSDVNRQGSHS